MTDMTDYVSMEQLASQMHVPCFLLVRYIDDAWARYNYPNIAFDLRIIHNGSECGENYIHIDDINTYKVRLTPYRNNIGSPQQALAATSSTKKDCGCNKRKF